MSDSTGAARLLMAGRPVLARRLVLELDGLAIGIRSNSAELLDVLERYFAHVVGVGDVGIEVLAIESEPVDTGVDFVDWTREPGKTGRKDAFAELADGRLIRKLRTGMVFLQSGKILVAAGPCREYDNQVINFINSQYMNWLQHRDWLICHAAGLEYHGKGLCIAGFSGGGKSTLMLHMLDNEAASYLTNDRLFIHAGPGGVVARGIPKLPRINPGTIVHNPRLQPLIPEPERDRLLALPNEELWQIEDKYDVIIDRLYGTERITEEAPLTAFLVLNWRRDSEQPLGLERVTLAERPDLLGAIMKSPGPFYQYADGGFFQDGTPFDQQAYLDVLAPVPVFEASGAIDFAALAERCLEEVI